VVSKQDCVTALTHLKAAVLERGATLHMVRVTYELPMAFPAFILMALSTWYVKLSVSLDPLKVIFLGRRLVSWISMFVLLKRM
jgi:hypothetical protein